MPFNLGGFELVLILLVIVIIFGVGKLPEVGAGIGKSIREFQKATREGETEEAKKDTATKTETKA